MSVIEAMAEAYDVYLWGLHKGGLSPSGIKAMRAALAEARRLGWQLVPVEPTNMQASMGENTIIRQHRRADIALEELSPRGDPHELCGAKETYRAMIAAAPSIEE